MAKEGLNKKQYLSSFLRVKHGHYVLVLAYHSRFSIMEYFSGKNYFTQFSKFY